MRHQPVDGDPRRQTTSLYRTLPHRELGVGLTAVLTITEICEQNFGRAVNHTVHPCIGIEERQRAVYPQDQPTYHKDTMAGGRHVI
jgi:hypothetical protein